MTTRRSFGYGTVNFGFWILDFGFRMATMGTELRIGFLGAGKMATALAKGFVNAGLARAGDLLGSDPMEGARQAFAKDVAAKATVSNAELLKFANVLVLAVKPDHVKE